MSGFYFYFQAKQVEVFVSITLDFQASPKADLNGTNG